MKRILKRKIDRFLKEWKNRTKKLPLIVKGARQVGKTASIRIFAHKNYKHFVEINFALQTEFRSIFDQGFAVDTIIKNISFINPGFIFEPGKTLIFFDELQALPNCATSLKSFKEDGRYDVICSGSLMGLSYQAIESNSVGYKEEYQMYAMDFEEFLWAKGYRKNQIEDIYGYLKNVRAIPDVQFNVLSECFKDYLVTGGMPAVVKTFIKQKNYSGCLKLQRMLLRGYEEDITKYAAGLDKAKILNVYRSIPVFLGQENKKFHISKVAPHARSRDYIGIADWLKDAGIVNICYCLNLPELPLKGNCDYAKYKMYYHDTGLLIASLDDEAQEDLRKNKNFNIYKGAVFENIAAQMLVCAGYNLFFYKNEKSTIEMDFFVRDKTSLIPVEVKARDGATASLNNLIRQKKYADIRYGIKLCAKNIGFNGSFYTIPYFLIFMLKRFLSEKEEN
ncbi:ATP-binding protein [Treponema sp. OMZ 840]|uniref:ATP-binding protein n=1 Tax=Treponema sp. OMZ 840 TaxID=244313 RepID=UPI003D8DE87D